MNEDLTTTLMCVCHVDLKLPGLGTVQKAKQCEWHFEGPKCPRVPKKFEFDWQCDPRKKKCAQLQYKGKSWRGQGTSDMGHHGKIVISR